MPFKRKTYGKVKPVKKPKLTPPARPQVSKLLSIYRAIAKSSFDLHIDHLAAALLWWKSTIPYIVHKREGKGSIPVKASRAIVAASDWIRKGQQATTNQEKERCYVAAIEQFRAYAGDLISDHPVAPYLKQYKENNKKKKEAAKKLVPRFDSFLTLLSQCFKSCPLTFEAVPEIDGNRDAARKVDHALGKMYYSRALVTAMQKTYRSRGLLIVAVEEGYHLARAMSYTGIRDGSFMVNPNLCYSNYAKLMSDFAAFASTPEAPKRLAKLPRAPKAKFEATERKPRMKRVDPFKQKSITQQLLDGLTKEASDGKAVHPQR